MVRCMDKMDEVLKWMDETSKGRQVWEAERMILEAMLEKLNSVNKERVKESTDLKREERNCLAK